LDFCPLLNKTIQEHLSRRGAKAQRKGILIYPNLARFAALREHRSVGWIPNGHRSI
jgi:hypothetical protein